MMEFFHASVTERGTYTFNVNGVAEALPFLPTTILGSMERGL